MRRFYVTYEMTTTDGLVKKLSHVSKLVDEMSPDELDAIHADIAQVCRFDGYDVSRIYITGFFPFDEE